MRTVYIREVVVNAVEAHVTYPFYRLERLADDHVNYWKFESPGRSILLSRQSIRTTHMIFDTGSDFSSNTQLTANLLDGTGPVDKIDKQTFDAVMNAHIVELLKSV